jgi:nicotinamide-nucleotide adenylyltransferase
MTTAPAVPQYRHVGMVARWQPVHLGHAAVVRALCRAADQVTIGIGSSNQHNLRTPFTYEETCVMLRLVLPAGSPVTLLPVPDLGNGPRWRAMVMELFGPLDLFVTANPYVASLLEEDYVLAHPADLLQPGEHVPVDGTMVRRALARGEGWQNLMPPEVVEYIHSNRLDERFRHEFGLQTIAQETLIS